MVDIKCYEKQYINMTDKERFDHAYNFVVDNASNEDIVDLLVRYAKEINQLSMQEIMQFISEKVPGYTWTKGLEAPGIIAHINYLNIGVESLKAEVVTSTHLIRWLNDRRELAAKYIFAFESTLLRIAENQKHIIELLDIETEDISNMIETNNEWIAAMRDKIKKYRDGDCYDPKAE